MSSTRASEFREKRNIGAIGVYLRGNEIRIMFLQGFYTFFFRFFRFCLCSLSNVSNVKE